MSIKIYEARLFIEYDEVKKYLVKRKFGIKN
jgi:hypothetical protein